MTVLSLLLLRVRRPPVHVRVHRPIRLVRRRIQLADHRVRPGRQIHHVHRPGHPVCQMSPLTCIHHVRENQAKRWVKRCAIPVAAANGSRIFDYILIHFPYVIRNGVCELVLID